MKLEQSFEVSAPIERVWKALVDVEHVAPCLPGAAVTGRNDDGTYNGTFTIRIGPTTAAYTGKLEMRDVDEATRAATMHAQGSDRRGQGGANATIFSKLTQVQPGVTRVEVDTDYHITGRLARFGRGGMIEDISERLLREFADRLQASLAPEPESVPEGEAAAAEEAGSAVGAEKSGTDESGAGDEKPADSKPAAEESPPATDGSQPAAEASVPPQPPPPPKAAAPPPPPPGPTAQPEPSEPIEGISLIGSVLWQRARRNPSPIVLAVAVLIALGFLRRRRG